MSFFDTRRFLRLLLLGTLLGLVATLDAAAQMTPDQQAGMLLASARRAYNEKNLPFAAARFREFLSKYASHRDLPSARYGLALCLLEGSERDPDKALEQLSQLIPQKTFPDHAFVLYYAGLARRGQGIKSVDQALARPAEAANHQNNARQRFDEASKHFAEAATSFLARAREAKAPDKGLPEDLEWAVRSRCDQAEMLLRLRKAKEARDAVSSFSSDKEWQKSRYLSLGLYYHGFASFLLGDLFEAGKALGRDSVLTDEVFGTHARYLVARVHHLNTKQNEREEARQSYQAVLRDHEANRKSAQEKLRVPEQFRNDLPRKLRLEALVKGPAPDHVTRAAFFLGVLQYEDGRHGEALEHFKSFATANPTSPLAPEARLRMGFCQVQLKQNDDALKTLQGLTDKEPALADQAFYWMARAQLNKADPKKPDDYKLPIETFRKAAERANQRASSNPPDPRARTRRGEILLEMADTQQLIKHYREAITTYTTIVNDKLLPAREDEILLSQATAHQLLGEFSQSDKVCARFLERHQASTLLPAILFRQAENSALQALAAAKLANPPDRQRETTKHDDEAIKRYTSLVEKYPEAANVNLARQGLGMAYYRKGDLEKAQKALEAIPATERVNELATVNYNLADVYLRQAPARAEDAVAAGKLEEKLKGASEMLEAFIGAAPDSPQVPDALLKQGYCQQRMAKLLAMPAEQQKMLAAARSAYERVQQKFVKHPAHAQATFERAKVLASLKEVNAAISELKKFSTEEGLKKSAIAPMALLHLGTILRGQNRAAEAVTVLADCRKDHEPALTADKTRAGWVLLLQYHHAAAQREAGKLEDARQLFDQVSRGSPDRPEAWDAALRAGQCQRDAGEKKIADGHKALAASGSKPDQRAAAEKLIGDGMQDLRNAVAYLATQEQTLRTRKPATDELQKTLAGLRGRMMYESAWGWRKLAEMAIDSARLKVQLDRWQKRREEVARLTPAGQTPPTVPLPEVRLEDVPAQPAEAQVRARYRELIKTFPELALNADARFELAEILSQRAEDDEAVKLLTGALEGEKEPSPELTDKIKVRLGTALLDRGSRKLLEGNRLLATARIPDKQKGLAEKRIAEGKKDVESALEQLQPVTGNPKSAMLAQATYREAECQLQLGKNDEAIKLLGKFRPGQPFGGLAGLSDRALLRLGWALGEQKQWEPSRQAYEALVGHFGSSPWIHEARYGMGWAYQNLAQYDNAVNLYTQVTGAVATSLAARAQLNVGTCRLLQKRYADASTELLVVPFTYDYPDLSALALLEAARAFSESKKTDQAVKLLRRVLRDHAGTAQAEAARKRLTELGES